MCVCVYVRVSARECVCASAHVCLCACAGSFRRSCVVCLFVHEDAVLLAAQGKERVLDAELVLRSELVTEYTVDSNNTKE